MAPEYDQRLVTKSYDNKPSKREKAYKKIYNNIVTDAVNRPTFYRLVFV